MRSLPGLARQRQFRGFVLTFPPEPPPVNPPPQPWFTAKRPRLLIIVEPVVRIRAVDQNVTAAKCQARPPRHHGRCHGTENRSFAAKANYDEIRESDVFAKTV